MKRIQGKQEISIPNKHDDLKVANIFFSPSIINYVRYLL